MAAQRAARTAVPTFREAAEREHKARCEPWRNAKQRDQWINSLRQHAFPKIGDMLVSDVSRADDCGRSGIGHALGTTLLLGKGGKLEEHLEPPKL